jgi:hypothetical protein
MTLLQHFKDRRFFLGGAICHAHTVKGYFATFFFFVLSDDS